LKRGLSTALSKRRCKTGNVYEINLFSGYLRYWCELFSGYGISFLHKTSTCVK